MVKRLALSDRAAWLEARRLGIGGSDAAAVLDLSPFSSPLQLFAEKLGLTEPDAESEAMRWGRMLEPLVADRYAEETKRTLSPAEPFTILVHPEHNYLRATLDREILVADGRNVPAVLEVKTTNAFRADEWLEEPPVHVQVQGQHQLLVTGRTWVSFAVLIGGNEFRWCDVERNDKFIAVMQERLAAFWRRLELNDPPQAGAEDKEVLAALYPADTGAEVPLPLEAVEWDATKQEADAQLKLWKAKKDEAENRLRAAIGDATFGILPGGGRYSHKLQSTTQPAREAATYEYRVLRRLTK